MARGAECSSPVSPTSWKPRIAGLSPFPGVGRGSNEVAISCCVGTSAAPPASPLGPRSLGYGSDHLSEPTRRHAAVGQRNHPLRRVWNRGPRASVTDFATSADPRDSMIVALAEVLPCQADGPTAPASPAAPSSTSRPAKRRPRRDRYAFVFRLTRAPEGTLVWTFVAFGHRHPEARSAERLRTRPRLRTADVSPASLRSGATAKRA
jgi:hypothetical protein